MSGKKQSILFTFYIILSFTVLAISVQPVAGKKIEPYFTLIAKTNTGDQNADYLNLIKQQVARIGINLEVIQLDWLDFVAEIIAYRNFDLCILGYIGSGSMTDPLNPYSEYGYLNILGYHTDMDAGKNLWYMMQGNYIMPPDSEERIQHYWDWEQYLMNEILPCQPMMIENRYEAHWSNLEGYDYKKGILQSWGQMDWNGMHSGQLTTNEVVIADNAWTDINPLFIDDLPSRKISDAIIDPLIWFDADQRAWPHLAKSWDHINDTYVRLNLREGIKWQTDPENNFTNEYFDVEDVYFTLFMWRFFSTGYLFHWIEEMKVVDQYTLDLFIDGDPETPENDHFAPYLQILNLKILPEHYLNQTQDVIGAPDIRHSSWNTFATQGFGTGLFEIDTFTEGRETILTVFPDCWRMNDTLTSDPDLNWLERFGDFSGGLNQLRIKQIDDFFVELAEYEQGKVDIVPLRDERYKRGLFELNPDHRVQNAIITAFNFLGYNMRPVRPVIGSYEPWPYDDSISKGLAIRKAISYAINREEMNEIIHGGEYTIIDHPVYATSGIWCNPNIIRYNHDLENATYYLPNPRVQTSSVVDITIYPLFILSEILLCLVFLLKRKK